MDLFFRPGHIFDDNPLYDVRLPYSGEIPPPGYILYQDSISYVHLGTNPFLPRPIYNYYSY